MHEMFVGYLEDFNDLFRIMKHALVFVGILPSQHSPLDQRSTSELNSDASDPPVSPLQQPINLLDSVEMFLRKADPTSPHSFLRVRLFNKGPSRSGFASSSAVAVNLLNALYHASNQLSRCDLKCLGALVMVFENELGWKSGRQDVDGILHPGIKNIRYTPTSTTLTPLHFPANGNLHELHRRFLIVDSGIPRNAALGVGRGLNMRHLSYLSHHPRSFQAIKKSIGLHHRIVRAFTEQRWRELGELFTAYMELRCCIDPSALMSEFDAPRLSSCLSDSSAGDCSSQNEGDGGFVLGKVFLHLIKCKLIYGGMFTGAMGSFVCVGGDFGV